MASDQIEQLISDVVGIADVDPGIARLWIRDAGRRCFEVRHWSFLRRRGQIAVPAAVTDVTTGATAAVSSSTPSTVTFSSAIADPSMVGLQIRFGGSGSSGASGPLYDIVGFNGTTSLEISPQWALSSITAQSFTIFLAYPTLPTDFTMFVSVADPVYRRRLRTNVQRESIDRYDAARSRLGGAPALLCPLDYSSVYAGSIDPALRIVGTGGVPLSGGVYTGPSDALFTVKIAASGLGGAATFQWKKNAAAAFSSSVLSDTATGNALSDGVTVLFDAATTYTIGDIHVIRTSATPTAGAPRMELYPYQSAQTVLPYVYVARYPDITDDAVTLPGIMARRDDVIREKALEFAATYPGTPDRPNNYEQVNRRDYHAANWRALIDELAREDNETMQTDVRSDPYTSLPMAPLPWVSGADLQSFDPPWIYPDYPAYT